MKRQSERTPVYLCEVEVTEGLESVTVEELRERFGKAVGVLPQIRAGEILFTYSGQLSGLRNLQTAYAVYVIYSYAVPRPRALLGDAHFRRLLEQIDLARELSPDAFRTFSIAAAGSETAVMTRLKSEIAARTGLQLADDKGDLLIRIRPFQDTWQTLIRLSARPLVTRPWRACNWQGALNAATAQAMIRLAENHSDDVYLNLGSGSGTLLIERLKLSPAKLLIGIDNDIDALNCAEANIGASAGMIGRRSPPIILLRGDMQALPLANASIDQVIADLPFGQLTGSHAVNLELYPRMLNETARVIRPRGQFTLVTHEMRLMDRLLRKTNAWHLEQSIQINLRGLHPKVYVLRRQANAL